MVRQEPQIAIVAGPTAAVADAARAAVADNFETEAVMHLADFGKIRPADIALRGGEFGDCPW